jgi:hypothetical protein
MGPLTRRGLFAGLLGGIISAARSHDVLESADAMALREKLEVFSPFQFWKQTHCWPAVSPDGQSICWRESPRGQPAIPFLRAKTVGMPARTLSAPGRICTGPFAIASGAASVIAVALSVAEHGPRRLVALNLLREPPDMRDITHLVTALDVHDIVHISSSSRGRVALGSREQIQLIDITNDVSVYAGDGWIPRVSADGTQLAFVRRDRAYIRSLVTGATRELLPSIPVKGVGGWSPNGEFLLAGAWTKRLVLEKRQIVIETATGRYSVMGTLGEGDYGEKFCWVSRPLLRELLPDAT